MSLASPPRKRRSPVAGCVARWRQDPEVRLMLRVRDGDSVGVRRVGEHLSHARFGLVLPSAGRPRRGGRPDARCILTALSRLRFVQAAGQLRHLDFPHRSERGPQRLAFAAAEAVLSTGLQRPRRAEWKSVYRTRRSAVAAVGARRTGRRGGAAVAELAGRQRARRSRCTNSTNAPIPKWRPSWT